MLHIDFETYSEIDLREVGVDVYSNHPSTRVVCMGFAFDEGPVHIWKENEAFPLDVYEHISCDGEFVAHNATFEILMWNNALIKQVPGLPLLDPRKATCTMAMSYAMGLPGSLEKAAAATGIKNQKDTAGSRVMMQLCKPKEVTPDKVIRWTPDKHPDKYEALYAYCRQDVEVERELHKRLLPLSPEEKKVWGLDFKINRRGVQADLIAVRKAWELIESEEQRLNDEMAKVTNGEVSACTTTGQLTDWIKSKGIEIEGVAKNEVTELLQKENLPSDVKRALLLRQEAAKSSTKKLKSLITSVSDDGRVRGIFQYHGASTGRWAGRRIQPQNFPRPKISQSDIDEIFNIFEGV